MTETNGNQLRIFAGRNCVELVERMCTRLKIQRAEARTEIFPDGETFVKVEEDVRGRDCYVVVSTCTPVNDNLMELLVFIDCLKRASAKRVTVVIPYFGYARQDRKDEGRVPDHGQAGGEHHHGGGGGPGAGAGPARGADPGLL